MDPVTTTRTATPQPSGSAQTATAIASDFETFLRMLTTQLENQDPLEPVASQDLAVQLATFSGVEQQTQTNSLLEDLGSQMGLMSLSQLASWVGMDALAEGNVHFDGSPVEIKPNIPALAEKAELVVYRRDGTEVQRNTLEPGTETVLWAGVGANGNPLPSGVYNLQVEAFANNESLPTKPVQAYREVVEVKAVNGKTTLVTAGGIDVAANAVVSLRQPQS
ncbi:flagellar hook capping protein FlgD [Dinoroseobacter shibae DFL 12 = DSM 16493]|jgi:flagellar basal-body rod modification protein FlgD|uniref:Basal-body rod modification protein FlgD n=1 Tax=Dinoroseobacter shibae (strain DSM 16493 / NCIMB 14021 / DFL 12) TaxID=398580 RepID=A8LNK4_DINSH|nr:MULTISPECIES: flagellar hook capping FlgD N-terminal domain-containing protein [Dinoroseobacter]ABV95098.1 flagellar hook capping protein FlgD [Dinoroseobacter shibae DFL 12 = DSM 16493]MDD9718181.1 flagellar hook capping FlgD N-terminal domain-containing protein [Dinoroseobacter sp. PD6]URF46513.1 flagellar hook assembly protein FlgD [Dinoroseobacter shibae]URF50819.1 flagellar hook assembly protein FlgD [Dinoroseobacter shibae]